MASACFQHRAELASARMIGRRGSVVIFACLFWLTARRGATDPVCGMKVDRAKAITKEFGGETYYFCSTGCLHAFEAAPDTYAHRNVPADHEHAAHAHP